jgi:peptidoglycan/xylan/chitin deacetylase (PgdA/CDA1 family)
MNRRQFTKKIVSGGLLLVTAPMLTIPEKSHYITLSFDDGFKKSFYKIADIYEEYGLKACLNVIASGYFKEVEGNALGNFDDWNKLQSRGHEIMPHSWEHQNLTELPLQKATDKITKCLDHFEKNLEGFDTSKAVYNFAYNASNTELEDFALERVRAVRTGGWHFGNDTAINPLPAIAGPVRIACQSYGPDNADVWVEKQVNDFLLRQGGWLVLNLHGLDGEGWGPVSSEYLSDLLKRLSKIDYLSVMPAGDVLEVSLDSKKTNHP